MKQVFGTFRFAGVRGQLLRGGAAGLAVRVMAILAGLLSSIVLARVLGPEQYGIYAFVFAIASLLALPVQMGLPTLIVRETAKSVALGDWPLLRGIWTWASQAILLGSVVIVGGGVIWLVAFGGSIRPERYEALIWGLLLVPLLAFGAAREAALRGLKHVFLGGFPDQVLRPLLLALFVGAAYALYSQTLTASIALAFSSIAAMLSFALGTALLLRARPAELKACTEKRIEHREWLRSLAPLSIIVGLQIVNQNTDLLLLGILQDDVQVGLYRIALSIGTLGVFGLMTFYLVAQPYIVAAYSRNNKQQLQSIARAIATVSLITSLMIAVVIWTSGEVIISLLYGAEYREAYIPLSFLIVGSVLHATFGMAGGVLTMTGQERLVLRVSAFSATLNIIGNLLLIPSFGMTGAAIATAGSLAVGEIVKHVIALRSVGIDGSVMAWARHHNQEGTTK